MQSPQTKVNCTQALVNTLRHQGIELGCCKVRYGRQLSNLGEEVLVRVTDLLNIVVNLRSDRKYEKGLHSE